MHNHKGDDFDGVADSMKQDLYRIPKWVKITDVVDFLESKYNVHKLN